ncbi:MAG TPA: SRPBCC domain-containing protein [Acidimicrobiia bacterium]|nr:SRPBCC domain-containing protein [Acidimicrobiia bacterium]
MTAWEPPQRLVFTWHPGLDLDEITEVEVRFASRGNVSVVELEHRGWEARGNVRRKSDRTTRAAG